MPIFKNSKTKWARIHDGFRLIVSFHLIAFLIYVNISVARGPEYSWGYLVISILILLSATFWTYIHYKPPKSLQNQKIAKIGLNIVALEYIFCFVILIAGFMGLFNEILSIIFVLPSIIHSLLNLTDINTNMNGIHDPDQHEMISDVKLRRIKNIKVGGYYLGIVSGIIFTIILVSELINLMREVSI
ncbi:hypothetical protein [Candidatus Lokiarchaeum ossiferum]